MASFVDICRLKRFPVMFILLGVVFGKAAISLLPIDKFSVMHRILPHIVVLLVIAAYMVVKDWILAGACKNFFRMLVCVFVFTRRTHLYHVNYILCTRIFSCLKRKLPELLFGWRVRTLNLSEGRPN